MSGSMMVDSPVRIPSAEELSRMFPELTEDELMGVDGGMNWWAVGGAVLGMIAVGFAVPSGGASLAAYGVYAPAAAGTIATFLGAVYR